jgi:hypothetical protein
VRGKINDLVKEAAELLEFQEVRTMRELIFLTERRGSNNDENQ